jgi:hypothetical protein
MAYNLAYFQAVASGFTRNEMIAATEEACDRARKPKCVPNPYSGPTHELMVVSADERGLILADNTFLHLSHLPRRSEALRMSGTLLTEAVDSSCLACFGRPYLPKIEGRAFGSPPIELSNDVNGIYKAFTWWRFQRGARPMASMRL